MASKKTKVVVSSNGKNIDHAMAAKGQAPVKIKTQAGAKYLLKGEDGFAPENVIRSMAQGTYGLSNQAKTGETLEYRIVYTNNGITPIGDLSVSDTTPVYTAFVSAAAGTTPAALTACVKATPANPRPAPSVGCEQVQPVGGSGAVSWRFSGSLPPGATGEVLFQVRVE